ncbi:MAG: radical SAM protein, partial [archaeon]
MKVNKINCKTILTSCKITGLNYSINPYVGCEHGCKYCYADFMKRFTNHKEPWGEFIDIKVNSPEILKLELAKNPKGTVWFSSVTDPYQPVEAKEKLTRKLLEIMLNSGSKLQPEILTKSSLVSRDFDLLQQF